MALPVALRKSVVPCATNKEGSEMSASTLKRQFSINFAKKRLSSSEYAVEEAKRLELKQREAKDSKRDRDAKLPAIVWWFARAADMC